MLIFKTKVYLILRCIVYLSSVETNWYFLLELTYKTEEVCLIKLIAMGYIKMHAIDRKSIEIKKIIFFY